MKNNFYCQSLPERFNQICPLCHENNHMMIRGLVADIETNRLHVSHDKGYSFCNCYNIFYTNWNNIDKRIYDSYYVKKYDNDEAEKVAILETKKLLIVLDKLSINFKSLLEIGCIQDYVLDTIKDKLDVSLHGLDIVGRDSKHKLFVGDFENISISMKYDIIHASHIFEHFFSPGNALVKCYDLLNENGHLYIAMPDTFFINFTNDNYQSWDWIVNEHHILWGMDSFIDFAKSYGFDCIWNERNTELFNRKDNKTFWKQDFKILLRKI